MQKKLLMLLTVGTMCVSLYAQKLPTVYAHRGCWLSTEIPENSVAAVEMAKRYGYPVIECDVHYTKDSVMVLMHDFNNMKRCIRKKVDNSMIEGVVKLSDLTFEELRTNYVLASDNPKYRTPVPTFEELMIACKENGITPLLHSDIVESYKIAQQMFGDNWIAFCSTDSILKEARKISNCLILLSMDKVTSDEAIQRLKAIGGRIGISSMNYRMFTKEFCGAIRKAGFEIQSSIFPTPYEAEAIRNGATILLSDFSYLPNKNKKPQSKQVIKRCSLPKGTSLDKGTPDEVEYGAYVLEITFKGSIEVILNGERHYVFTREDYGTDYVGMRFYRNKPDIKILAREDTAIKKGKVSIYQF